MFALTVLGLSCLKLLLMPAYRSTDFEVHRNWLAVTHSLPLDQWYTDTTSEWTLDYPPLFAWFEWLLAKMALYFDPEMLRVGNLNYASELTILFQRLSVIITDLVYAYGCKLCSEQVAKNCGRRELAHPVFLVLVGNAGLLLVDHIHFQYNGFLSGILFISIARMLQKREVESAFWFSILLNLKHIYLYIAPAYLVYLLRTYTLAPLIEARLRTRTLIDAGVCLVKLGVTVLGVTALSFGPFIANGQLFQVLSRLFPFKRGLSHAYWAPNFWALYNFGDKVLLHVGSKYGYVNVTQGASMTGGLVQEFEHSVLPSVSPIVALIATILAIVPCLINLWRTPHNPWQFVRALVLCAFGSYMFGWHVHEKAILLVILPLGLLGLQRKAEAGVFVMMSIIGHFSILPLFFTPHETPIKVCALVLHAVYTTDLLNEHWEGVARSGPPTTPQSILPCIPMCNPAETIYLLGLFPLLVYLEIGHKLLGLDARLPFLPLMLTSVYCAAGVTYCWGKYLYGVYTHRRIKRKVH